jgi:hypothetical protein
MSNLTTMISNSFVFIENPTKKKSYLSREREREKAMLVLLFPQQFFSNLKLVLVLFWLASRK